VSEFHGLARACSRLQQAQEHMRAQARAWLTLPSEWRHAELRKTQRRLRGLADDGQAEELRAALADFELETRAAEATVVLAGQAREDAERRWLARTSGGRWVR
jgi:hypothetical protein